MGKCAHFSLLNIQLKSIGSLPILVCFELLLNDPLNILKECTYLE